MPDKVKRQLEFMQQNNLDYSLTDLFLYNQSDRLIQRRLRKYIKYDDSDNLSSGASKINGENELYEYKKIISKI